MVAGWANACPVVPQTDALTTLKLKESAIPKAQIINNGGAQV